MREFDYQKATVLEDDVVRLSPLQASHIEALAEVAADPGIWTYFLEHGCGEPHLTRYVRAAIAQREAGQAFPFVMHDQASGRIAGLTHLYELNPSLGTLKLGHTWLGIDFQGTGLNTHAKFLLFAFAFDTLGAARIGFGVHGDNARSLRALDKVGVQREGVLRSYLPRTDGSRADLVLLSLLRGEWEADVRRRLRRRLHSHDGQAA
ncbi:MAG: GNAT family protein [Bacteroidota bacterium]